MAARDVSDGIGHRQHRQPEGKSDAKKADSEDRKRGGEHGGAAAAKDEPEGAKNSAAARRVMSIAFLRLNS